MCQLGACQLGMYQGDVPDLPPVWVLGIFSKFLTGMKNKKLEFGYIPSKFDSSEAWWKKEDVQMML